MADSTENRNEPRHVRSPGAGRGVGAAGDQAAGPVRGGVGRRLRRTRRGRLADRGPIPPRPSSSTQSTSTAPAVSCWVVFPPTPDELTRRRLRGALPELAGPRGGLPDWATSVSSSADEVVFARSTLDLDAVEAADARQWPPVTVAAYQESWRASLPSSSRSEPSLRRPASSPARLDACPPHFSTRPTSSTRSGAVKLVSADDQAFVAELGRRVRLHRLYQRMTQDQLAERARLSRSFISLFETGERGIDVRALRRIAQALDLALPALVVEPGEDSFPWRPAAEERGGVTDDETTFVADLGPRVRVLRTARRVSQDRLAETAKVSRVTLGSIERGAHAAGILAYRVARRGPGRPAGRAVRRQLPARLPPRRGAAGTTV